VEKALEFNHNETGRFWFWY